MIIVIAKMDILIMMSRPVLNVNSLVVIVNHFQFVFLVKYKITDPQLHLLVNANLVFIMILIIYANNVTINVENVLKPLIIV